MFCHLEGLHSLRLMFLLMELYMNRRGHINACVGYNYVPRGNAEDVETLKLIFLSFKSLSLKFFNTQKFLIQSFISHKCLVRIPITKHFKPHQEYAKGEMTALIYLISS